MSDVTMREAAEQAMAWSHTFHLLGALYLDGVSPESRGHVALLEELAAALGDEPDYDELAAVHQRIFGFDVFPFQGVFLGEEAQVGGAETDAVLELYREADFPVALSAESPDHLGVELWFLAWLCRREAEGDPMASELGRRFLDEQLLWWLPAFVGAVRALGEPVTSALASVTLELVLAWRGGLGGAGGGGSRVLPPMPLDVTAAETSLNDIAERLTVPVWAGIFWSRDGVLGLGRRAGVPVGFGGRRLMLVNLLQSASRYEAWEAVLAALVGQVEEALAWHRGLAEGRPWLVAASEAWCGQLLATRERLGVLVDAANRLEP